MAFVPCPLNELDKWAKRASDISHDTGMKFSYGDLQTLETVQIIRMNERAKIRFEEERLGGLELDERTRYYKNC